MEIQALKTYTCSASRTRAREYISYDNNRQYEWCGSYTDGQGRYRSIWRKIFPRPRNDVYDFIVVKRFDSSDVYTIKVWKGDFERVFKGWNTKTPCEYSEKQRQSDLRLIDTALF